MKVENAFERRPIFFFSPLIRGHCVISVKSITAKGLDERAEIESLQQKKRRKMSRVTLLIIALLCRLKQTKVIGTTSGVRCCRVPVSLCLFKIDIPFAVCIEKKREEEKKGEKEKRRKREGEKRVMQ